MQETFPPGVKKQILLFLRDYPPRFRKQLVRRYLALLGSQDYLSRPMGRTGTLLVESTIPKKRRNKPKEERNQPYSVNKFFKRVDDKSWERCLEHQADLIVYTIPPTEETCQKFCAAFDLTDIANPIRITSVDSLPSDICSDLEF